MKPRTGLSISLLVLLTAACNSSQKDTSPSPQSSSQDQMPVAGTSPSGSSANYSSPGLDGSNAVEGGARELSQTLRGVWGLTLAQKPRNCSTLYDFREARTVSLHILCPGSAGRNLSLQTENFFVVSDNGTEVILKRSSSTCGPTSQDTVSFSYAVSSIDGKKTLVLKDAKGTSPSFQSVAEADLAADLNIATSLYGRALSRGCFKDGQLALFAVKGETTR